MKTQKIDVSDEEKSIIKNEETREANAAPSVLDQIEELAAIIIEQLFRNNGQEID
jgi:hypothetical protein